MNEQEILSITIDHREPLELKRFTASMLCVESQYKKHLATEGIVSNDYHLYVHEVKQGSIVIDFIKGKAKKLFEDYILEKFLSQLKNKIESVKQQEKIDDRKDLKDIGTIMNVIANDYSSNMTFNVHIGKEVTNTFNLSGIEANAVKNECVRQLDAEEQLLGEVLRNVVLHWKSAVDDKKSQTVDKGIIEEVDPQKKVKLVCNEELKQQMISENDNNPFNMFFIVDAQIKRIDGKAVAYVITKIHGSGKLDG